MLKRIVMIVVLLLSVPLSAMAFSIDLDYSKDISLSGSFATVTGWVDASNDKRFHFTVELDSGLKSNLNGGGNFGMQHFAFNTDLTLDESMFTFVNPSSWDANFNPNATAGYGKFSVQTDGNGNSRTENLHFMIDYTTMVTESNFLHQSTGTAGEGHGQFAAHVGGFSYSGEESTWVRDGGPAPVPEPSTLLLLGGGLIGLAAWRRRKS